MMGDVSVSCLELHQSVDTTSIRPCARFTFPHYKVEKTGIESWLNDIKGGVHWSETKNMAAFGLSVVIN